MERVTHKTFEKKCLLLKKGYRITGDSDSGTLLKKTGASAVIDLILVCGFCKYQYHGCNPSADTNDKTAITAKIKT